MSVINKQLYDALIIAKVPDDLATAASVPDQLADERSNNRLKTIEGDIAGIKTDISVLNQRMSTVEKMLWAVILGVLSIVFKTYFS